MPNANSNIDTLIVNRLRDGDKAALTELYNTYWELLFISAQNVLKDREKCEDIIQDVFMNIWQNRKKLVINISLKSYLYACVRYQVFHQFRKNKDNIQVEFFNNLDTRFQHATPETEMMHEELVQQITSIIKSFPKKRQLVYKLSREEQLSHKEIAERLNISTKTVENHITKSLQTIRLSMGSLASMAMIIWLTKDLFE